MQNSLCFLFNYILIHLLWLRFIFLSLQLILLNRFSTNNCKRPSLTNFDNLKNIILFFDLCIICFLGLFILLLQLNWWLLWIFLFDLHIFIPRLF